MTAELLEECLDIPLKRAVAIMHSRLMDRSTYWGVKAFRNPIDSWVYQEIMFETRPDVVVEVGSAEGGGVLFLAHMCDLLGHGKVIGLDLTHDPVPEVVRNHPRVTLIEGDSCENVAEVEGLIAEAARTQPSAKVMVIEDSSHTYENTLNVLRTFGPLVSLGCYLVVEDGIGHHGLPLGPNPGPYEAVETFVGENSDFEIDRDREEFFLTWNPKGYLKRVRSGSKYLPIQRPARRVSLSDAVRLLTPPIVLKTIVRARRRMTARA